MDGLRPACLYSVGCAMGEVTGVDKVFLNFLKNSDEPEKQAQVRDILTRLKQFSSYGLLSGSMGSQDVFSEEVVRAYWLGDGRSSLILTHNYQVLKEIETMRKEKKLPARAVNRLLGCLVSFGEIIEVNSDKLLVLHHSLSYSNRFYVWRNKKQGVKIGFVANPKPGDLVSIHYSIARELITRSQARLLGENTRKALFGVLGS